MFIKYSDMLLLVKPPPLLMVVAGGGGVDAAVEGQVLVLAIKASEESGFFSWGLELEGDE